LLNPRGFPAIDSKTSNLWKSLTAFAQQISLAALDSPVAATLGHLRLDYQVELPEAQMEHSISPVLAQFSEHFGTQQELPGNPLQALHQ
jgi:hypothetical protein